MIKMLSYHLSRILFERSKATLPDSSGFVDEQSASFPGRDDDFNTLFCRTNSLALFAARAA